MLLGNFADQRVGTMTEAQLDRLEALLDVPEPVIYDWLAGQSEPPPEFDHDVMRLLREFRFRPARR